MRDIALSDSQTWVEGRTTYKIYSSDAEFLNDPVRLSRDYRINILAEDEVQRFLKRYKLRHDKEDIVVVSYTQIQTESYDPFAVKNI